MVPLSPTDEEEMPRDAFALVDLLHNLYPERCIRPGQDPVEAHRYAAVRAFIDELMSWRDETLAAMTTDEVSL